jgi:hypothetical protein
MAATPAEEAPPTPQPTPQPSQPQTPPSVTTATGPQQAPGGEPRETGSTQGPPPAQQTPPATGTQGLQPPEEKNGTNWGAVCAIGCGIMLLLAILAGVGLFLFGRWAQDRVNELPQTVPNVMDTGEQDGGESDGPTIIEPGDEQGNGEGVGPGDSGPGDTGQSDRPGTEDLGELMGRLGEAVEGLGEAMSATNIEGFDPSTVDATMLPTFYGFMVALAEDNPQGMHRWMSPDYKEEWSPDSWAVSPHIEHLSYELQEKATLDDGTVKFVIEEGVRDNQENTEDVLSWEIHFKKIGDQWYVTHFE